MQLVAVLALVSVCLTAAAVLAKPADETYTTKWDGIDLDQILQSDRLLQNYHNCLMDKGSCTPDGSDLKKTLPDALESDCSKCSKKQKEGSTKVINHLRKNKPEWWKELQAKYDPKGVYAAKNPQLQ